MDVIDLPRGYGKTEIAIKRAHETGAPIIVSSNRQKTLIEERIRGTVYGDVIVYTLAEWVISYGHDYVIIDELASVLSTILGATVEMATLTSKEY